MSLLKKRVHVSVKEAFDNLPMGLCYFNQNGIPVLCNRTMQRLVFMLTGRDLQQITELKAALENPNSKIDVELKDGIYYLPNKSAWRFVNRVVKDEGGNCYTEYVASDVTELCMRRIEMEKDNEHLKEMSKQLQRLSANVVTATREEEILALKMRIHDQMGRSLVVAHKVLKDNEPMENVNAIIKEWKASIELLCKAGNEPEKTDTLAELKRISEGMIKIITTGALPKQEDLAYLITTAIRECVTNAIRYAHATELYASMSCENGYAQAVISNNGVAPTEEIREGGGLSSLRRRIERHGGIMKVSSLPKFELKVIIPIREEE